MPPATDQPSPQARSAFDEMGRLLLDDHSMESVLQKVADLAKAVIPGASEVSLTLVDGERVGTVVHTGELAIKLDESHTPAGTDRASMRR